MYIRRQTPKYRDRVTPNWAVPPEPPYICNACKIECATSLAYWQHWNWCGSIASTLYNCQYCKKQIPKYEELVVHQAECKLNPHVQKSAKHKFICESCGGESYDYLSPRAKRCDEMYPCGGVRLYVGDYKELRRQDD